MSAIDRLQSDCRLIQQIRPHLSEVKSCDVSHTGYLATASCDKTVSVWRFVPRTHFRQCAYSPLTHHKFCVNCVRFSSDGRFLFSCSTDGTLVICFTETGAVHKCLQHEVNVSVRVCTITLDASCICSGTDDGLIYLWDWDTVHSVCLLSKLCSPHPESITCLSFSRDGRLLCSGSQAGDFCVWSVQCGACLAVAACAHEMGLQACEFLPNNVTTGDSEQIVSCGNDQLMRVWQFDTHVISGDISRPPQYRLQITRELCLFANFGFCTCLRLCTGWDFSKDPRNPMDPVDPTLDVDDSLDSVCSHLLATCDASEMKRAQLWDTRRWQCADLHTTMHARIVTSVSLSRLQSGECLLVSAANDGSVNVHLLPRLSYVDNLFCLQASDWSINDVCDWLKIVGLGAYTNSFAGKSIDGPALLRLDQSSLLDLLQADSPDAASRLLQLISRPKNCDVRPDTTLEPDIRKETLGIPGNTNEVDCCFNTSQQYEQTPAPNVSHIPPDLFCPITKCLMRDPVIASDGFSYERAAINQWLRSSERSPVTNQPLSSAQVVTNRALQSVIGHFTRQ